VGAAADRAASHALAVKTAALTPSQGSSKT
jgi:hypothetical protein